MKKIIMSLILSLMLSSQSYAAFVTIDEAGMDDVFSQVSFGANTVDIRIGALTTFVRPDLLDIQLDSQLNDLFGLHVGGFNIVNFYFVDVVDECGGFNVNIIGCGEKPGNDFVVESSFAATGINAELLSHELGHNLNLGHRDVAGALMAATINNGIGLNSAEVSTVLASGLIQSDGSGLFIQVNPVLIVASSTVPEPVALLPMLLGFGLLFSRKRTV